MQTTLKYPTLSPGNLESWPLVWPSCLPGMTPTTARENPIESRPGWPQARPAAVRHPGSHLILLPLQFHQPAFQILRVGDRLAQAFVCRVWQRLASLRRRWLPPAASDAGGVLRPPAEASTWALRESRA